MQLNRRRANLFKINTLIEKKNCQRCYRLHKKCNGGTPSCSNCTKAKTACTYIYDATENKLDVLHTTQSDSKFDSIDLQRNLEQQKQAYRLLEEQLEQIKAQNLTLQNMNLYLSQALSAKMVQENQLASASEKQDLLGIYRNNGYYYVRVTPLFTDVYQYIQEKSVGRNPLKTVTMELAFSAAYLLLGKSNEGYHYVNKAVSEMTASNLNSPMGLICMFMLAENLFIAGDPECVHWLHKIRAMFSDMDNSLMDPKKARTITNQLTMLSQIMDINFAKSVSIMWAQWTAPPLSRVDQYLKQLEVSKILDDPVYKNINSPCCVPSYYILLTISEIVIAMEHQIDCPDDIPVITEQNIIGHFNQLVEYSIMTSDPKMRENLNMGILIIKALVAVITSNYLMFDLLMTEVMSAGYLDEENPSPHDSMPLYLLLQLLYFLQSPLLPKVIQQFEKWSKSFPIYQRWIDMVTRPSVYPVQLNGLEDCFLVLPHLNYMRQNNIAFKMHLPIFNEDSAQITEITDSLLLTPFDVSSSPSNDGSHESSVKSPSDSAEQYSDSSLLGEVTYAFSPSDFAVNEYEIENIVM